MAQKAKNKAHANQIKAGSEGRKRGHHFEEKIAYEIISLDPKNYKSNNVDNKNHVYQGNPSEILYEYILLKENIKTSTVKEVRGIWTGGLATSGKGDCLLDKNGQEITECKSDVIVTIKHNNKQTTKGVSVKNCTKTTSTNDQMFFTTATAFCDLLENNKINIPSVAKMGLKMFCGDNGCRPVDLMPKNLLSKRKADPDRYFWEEISKKAQIIWEEIFNKNQDKITKLLFQKAYKKDPFPPDYLLHKTKKSESFDNCDVAIFSIDEITSYSRRYSKFSCRPYTIKKGRFKDDPATHLAPRFGFIQFQRGGQKQHPTQLQFNLMCNYFKHLS